MKKLTTILLAALTICSLAFAQTDTWTDKDYELSELAGKTIIDSVKWVFSSIDLNHIGCDTCQHNWAYHWIESPNCYSNSRIQKRICYKCYRIEIWKEMTYSHKVESPKSDFEKVLEEIGK